MISLRALRGDTSSSQNPGIPWPSLFSLLCPCHLSSSSDQPRLFGRLEAAWQISRGAGDGLRTAVGIDSVLFPWGWVTARVTALHIMGGVDRCVARRIRPGTSVSAEGEGGDARVVRGTVHRRYRSPKPSTLSKSCTVSKSPPRSHPPGRHHNFLHRNARNGRPSRYQARPRRCSDMALRVLLGTRPDAIIQPSRLDSTPSADPSALRRC